MPPLAVEWLFYIRGGDCSARSIPAVSVQDDVPEGTSAVYARTGCPRNIHLVHHLHPSHRRLVVRTFERALTCLVQAYRRRSTQTWPTALRSSSRLTQAPICRISESCYSESLSDHPADSPTPRRTALSGLLAKDLHRYRQGDRTSPTTSIAQR